ncbi:hypothetical protein [Arthrobacter sp. S39]|uniref:hypothetical protein n=1 Tax=Arthrobacter sp. S39 TaxID=2509720 RepID=UPI0010376712|nr:hypothetical protein [Arthrobacter sp. S39]TAP45635.1 hypothetical protein EYS21_02650 [Arthrobacter sp. S39]
MNKQAAASYDAAEPTQDIAGLFDGNFYRQRNGRPGLYLEGTISADLGSVEDIARVQAQLRQAEQQLAGIATEMGAVADRPAALVPAFKAGQRVKYVGMHGNADGPVVRVWRATRHGVWVTMPDGSRQQWHPEDVRAAADR